MTQLDNKSIPSDADEVRLFACVRNEACRLPYFLKYYSERGVSRFFFVDNGSSDGTTDLLLAHEHVHVFSEAGSFARAGCGILWTRELLDSFGRGRWCIVVDADEFLVYPGWEELSIPDFCGSLDAEGASALHCLLTDMYSALPLSETAYVPGTDPLAVCPYFESESILCVGSLAEVASATWRHYGGMRLRLFGLNVRLDKATLFKHGPTTELQEGTHSIIGARLSGRRGAVLHFKYLMDFSSRVFSEAERGEHWSQAAEYRRYKQVLKSCPHLTAYSELSHRFYGSEDLVRCDIMRTTSSTAH